MALVIHHQVFQYDWYSQILNKNACAISVLRKLSPGMTYVLIVFNTTTGQIKTALGYTCRVCI